MFKVEALRSLGANGGVDGRMSNTYTGSAMLQDWSVSCKVCD
jgi:hypothetical protein